MGLYTTSRHPIYFNQWEVVLPSGQKHPKMSSTAFIKQYILMHLYLEDKLRLLNISYK